MTLCIAALVGSDAFLMGDTQLTSPVSMGAPPLDVLKTFFLDESTAIAYAGAAGKEADGRIRAIYESRKTSDIRLLAEVICRSFDREVDFVLAKVGSAPMIAKVSHGEVACETRAGSIYWIGDPAAANAVSQVMNLEGGRELPSAFSEVVQSKKFLTVGGHATVARGKDGSFRYVPYLQLTSPYYQPKPGRVTVDFGTAQTGGFGFTTVTPKSAGVNGWGIYYFQGKYGLYFAANLDEGKFEKLKAYANNVEEFVRIVEGETGIDLEHCGSLGQ